MTTWKKTKLDELGKIVGGATPSTKNENYYGGDISWITPKDLSSFQGRFIQRGDRNLTIEGLNSCSAQLMPQHSILFTSRAPIGYVAIAANEVCTNQGFKSIIPNDKTDYLYLYYLLLHNRNRIENMGSGTTFKEVSASAMRAVEVSVPTDIEEQKQIAKVLGALDDKVENNTKLNHHLEQIAQAIFKSWFVDFEPWGGTMPADWREVSLGTVCDIKGGKRLPKGSTLTNTPTKHPYIRVRDMNNAIFLQKNNTLEYVEEEIQRSIARYTVSTDDVIVSIVGTIGLVCKVHPSLDNANLTENCVKLTNLNGVTSDFLYLFLSSSCGQEAMRQGTVGAVQAKLPIKNIQALIFRCPSVKVLSDFSNTIESAMQEISSKYAENRHLSNLRDSLLPRLMSGELSVTDLPAK